MTTGSRSDKAKYKNKYRRNPRKRSDTRRLRYVVFDGTNDFFTGSTLPADCDAITCVAWLKPYEATNAFYLLNWTSLDALEEVTLSGQLRRNTIATGGRVSFAVADGVGSWTIAGTNTLTHADRGENCVLVSYSRATGEARTWISKNGVETQEHSSNIGTLTAFFGPAAQSISVLGAAGGGATGKMNGQVGMIWCAPVFYDFDVEANRRLFVDANGEPVLTPPADSPFIYFGNQQTAADWNAATNQGSLSGLTMNGSVVDV